MCLEMASDPLSVDAWARLTLPKSGHVIAFFMDSGFLSVGHTANKNHGFRQVTTCMAIASASVGPGIASIRHPRTYYVRAFIVDSALSCGRTSVSNSLG